MKTLPILLSCLFLLPDPASAQLTAEQKAEVDRQVAITMRAGKLLLEAESRAMEQCATTRVTVPLPHWDGVAKIERTVNTTVAIEWSGACADGKRDGGGVLTWIQEKVTSTRIDQGVTLVIRSTTTWRSEGRFVRGQRAGLWCGTRKYTIAANDRRPTEGTDGGCSVLAGHANPLTPSYQKQSDGSWVQYVVGSPTASSLAAGALEALSAKALADASAGKVTQGAELVVRNPALDDLVRGSKIVLAPTALGVSLKDKRVAVVLSSGTVSDLERFTRERQALIAASAGLRGNAGAYRAQFIAASSPDRLLTNLARVVRPYARSVQSAEDLTGLADGSYDYALILDWKHMTRFDLLGKFESFPVTSTASPYSGPAVACESMAGFLVDRELKAVLHLVDHPNCHRKFEYALPGDEGYMLTLSSFFEGLWGKTVDDQGSYGVMLNTFLKTGAGGVPDAKR